MALRIAVALFVSIACGALVTPWRAMKAARAGGWWFAIGMLWPVVLAGVPLFVIGNRMLRAAVLASRRLPARRWLVTAQTGSALR
jgi:hypothetical protein